jgi:hypothetical protein
MVTEANEVNNRNTGSYTLIEMATVMPPSTITTGGTPVIMRGVAKPYGKKWPVGCPTATFTPAGAGSISDVITNMQGDGSITFTPAAGFAGIDTITFQCGTSTASGTINVQGITATNAPVGPFPPGQITSPAETELMDVVTWQVPNVPTGGTVQWQMRRTSTTTWTNMATQSPFVQTMRVAGTFRMRAVISQPSGVTRTTTEFQVEVRFPSYNTIVANAGVQAATDAAWGNTLAATTPTTRREEGFWIRLNTATGVYEFTATVTGPVVGNDDPATINLGARPADTPAIAPLPNGNATYTVASFHTHTPTTHRTVGRAVGPSAADVAADNADDVTGVVYDYVGDGAGNIPAGHPLNSPAQRYQSGPIRRSTP